MEFLLKASAITALFYLCYKLFLQGETFFESNRWFLLSGLIISVCISIIVIPIYVENTNFTNFLVLNETISEQPIIEESFNYLKLLPLIYGLGVVFFLTKLCIEFSSLYKLLNNNVTKSLGSEKYIETQDTVSPFSFFNYIVYNPNQFNDTELKHIINHEKVHAKQKHSIDILLIQIATVIFWFNPFIWFYKKDLQQNLEFIADQNAQRVSSCQKSYQHLLIKATVSNQQLILANNFYNSLIKKRIVMLHKSKSHKLNVLKYALVLPLLGLFLMSFNTKEMYIESEMNPAINANGDIEMVIITKDFKDTDFEKIKKEFKNKGVDLKFKGIKRNSKDEIIAIKIDASTGKSNANFNTSSDDAIKPIKITYNSDGNSISIGNGHDSGHRDYHFTSNDGHTKVLKSSSGSNVFVVLEEHEDHDEHEGHEKHEKHEEHEEHEDHDTDEGHEEHEVKVIIKEEDGTTKKRKSVYSFNTNSNTNTENVFIIQKDKDGKETKQRINLNDDGTYSWIDIDNKNGSPLIIIDDKESTREVMESLSPNSIQIMNVLKDEKATELYGEKGKNGVIIITTKK